MKKFLAAALAASLALPLATPALAKPQPQNHGRQVSEAAHARNWARGQKFERKHAPNYRVISYRENRRLTAPPRGYRWVRSGDDAILVRVSTGIISRVVTNIF